MRCAVQKLRGFLVLPLIFLATEVVGFENQSPFLDPPYQNMQPPLLWDGEEFLPLQRLWRVRPLSNNLAELIGLQTPVKSQERRGICSVFSAAGIFESILKRKSRNEIDVSENYLAYIVISKVLNGRGSGSTASENFRAFRQRGGLEEGFWPYEGQDWTVPGLAGAELEKREEVCGSLSGKKQEICFRTHRDPDRDPFKVPAKSFERVYGTQSLEARVIPTQNEAQLRLSENEPVLLELTFFYGAWNHRKMLDVGLGEPDFEKWVKGEVGIPTVDDINRSKLKPAGHSIVLVGYDTSRKVYFFKNSWGTASFGMESDLLGPGTTPGYGTIPFEYAHRFGTFYRVVDQ